MKARQVYLLVSTFPQQGNLEYQLNNEVMDVISNYSWMICGITKKSLISFDIHNYHDK